MYGLLVFFMEIALSHEKPKCIGRWAIHSCGGGNGKRSDLDIETKEILDNVLPEFVSRDVRIVPDDDVIRQELIKKLQELDYKDGESKDVAERRYAREEWTKLIRRLLERREAEEEEDADYESFKNLRSRNSWPYGQ